MSRKKWLAVGLSMLVGTGIATTLPVGALASRDDATVPRAQFQQVRWGEQGGEQGEVEAPRADGGYQGGDRTDTGAPRV